MNTRATRIITGVLLAAFAPYIALQVLLYVEYLSGWHSQAAEFIFLIASISLGALGVMALPLRRAVRYWMLAPYLPLMMCAIWFAGLLTVCGYFGDCL